MAGSLARNPWGDELLPARRPLSVVATLALVVSAASFVLGPLRLLIGPVADDPPATILSGALLLLSLVMFPVGLALAYSGLAICRPGRPIAGRWLAWLGVGLGLASLVWWYTALAWPLVPYPAFGLWIILAIAAIHALALAADSPAGKYLVVGLVLAAVCLSLLSCWILSCQEEARRVRMQDTLRRLVLEPGELASPEQERRSPWEQLLEFSRDE